MKKTGIFALILSAALLCGCGANEGSQESSSEDVIDSNNSSSESSSAEVIDSGDVSSESSSAEVIADKKSYFYAQAALNAVEFPEMIKVESKEEIDAFFSFDTANYEDYSFYTNLMSTNLNHIIVVKPIEGKYDEVFAELMAFYNDQIENVAFYPAQEASAAGAEIDETADGYIYIIFHEDGDIAAEAIKKACENYS